MAKLKLPKPARVFYATFTNELVGSSKAVVLDYSSSSRDRSQYWKTNPN